MQTLFRHAVEVICSVWLVIVAVQYLSRYFVPELSADFAPVYCVMLALLIAAGALRVLRKAE